MANYLTLSAGGLYLPIEVAESGGNLLLSENYDDQTLDARIGIYDGNMVPVSPPVYNLTTVGRGGTGYCLASGTSADWRQQIAITPWTSDEFYVSFWMAYPTYEYTDPNENFKVFYPRWDATTSYVHFSATADDTIYYSARQKTGAMLEVSVYLTCTDMFQGAWHHYEFYVQFSTATVRFWYDSVLKLERAYGGGYWTASVDYFDAPGADAEEAGTFSRQIDDLEIWDGMP